MCNRLKELRENKNLTQQELSEKLKISRTLYSLYESGKRDIPVKLLSKIAKFYNTSIDFIVGDTDQIIPYSKNNNVLK